MSAHSPFTSDAQDRVDSIGENRLIARIAQWLVPVNPPAPRGIGDDCAVIHPPTLEDGSQLLTTDVITYGHHFDDSVSPEDAGSKLIRRNLSDIAAMGGRPGPALLTLLCGPDLSLSWLERFFNGARRDCEHFGVEVVGGDVSALQPGNFSAVLTQTGYARHPVQRTGARPGDRIYVTGSLGGSVMGKHCHFEPRLAEGLWLANRSGISSMMDLSDGLAKDLPALVPVGCHAGVNLNRVPCSPAAAELSEKSGDPPLKHAFCDGEDYELLFTYSEDRDPGNLEQEWAERFPDLPLTAIGSILAGSENGTIIDAGTGRPLPWTHGFEHFR